jgi:hypothetical protein
LRSSTVAFPNHDPFNHNVFSLAPEATFDLDLGLDDRGEAKSTCPRATMPCMPGMSGVARSTSRAR